MQHATTAALPRTMRLLQGALIGSFAAAALVSLPARADLTIGNNPLYLVIGKANVLIVLANNNGMDEAPNGTAIGSFDPGSRSEIARGVVRSLTDTYRSRVNMGLMSFRLNPPAAYSLHSSPYDVSFDPATYDPAWVGRRDSPNHKRFRSANPSSPGDFIYYNINLPFYDGNNQGTAFCYSGTADASNNFVDGNGWDAYRCFTTKTGPSNALPAWGDGASEAANGWSGYWFGGVFWSTDSDYAQGITDFGRFMSWNYVGPTWFRNDSPGRGYLNIPLADLGSAQAAAIKVKLACNVPGNPGACTAAGLQNAGLTPLEGTLQTARDYYLGNLINVAEGYTNSCYPLPQSCGKNFVVMLTNGLPNTDKNGNVMANPPLALAQTTAAAADLKAKGVETYVIGFALPFGTDPTTLNQIAVAGGTVTAYNANDSASLQAAFDAIFNDIFRKTSAFGSVSQNSTSINTGSLVFQGRFDSTDWTGEVVALRPETDGTLTPMWNSSDNGRMPAPAVRKVYTLVPGTGGVEFKTLANLGAAQQAALSTAVGCGALAAGCAQARIDWLRGVRTQEDPAGPLRRRSRVFGDVISSAPYFVKASNTLFIGANDGMLHAIDVATGNERFTFIPNAVTDKLHKLTWSNYAHDYYVDGEIAVSGEFETPGQNILVGALGRGGKALFALDVTDPVNFNASKVMWEFTDPDLGLVLGNLVIAKMNNGDAAVIVGNGYNSANERSFLFVINLKTGALIRKIDTGAGSAAATNGLATPRGWDENGDGTVDTLYAGDLLGNLWKFDVSSAAPADWGSAYVTAGAPSPLFVAADALGKRQPITGMVGLGVNAIKGDANFGKRYVYFGTGRYITTDDVTDTSVQSWYGLIEGNTAITTGRAALKQRTIEIEGSGALAGTRAFSLPTAGDMAGKRGWYIDLVSPVSGKLGERMIGENKFFGTVLVASSMIPSNDQCTPGGQGYLNAVDPFTGAALTNLFFDANNDLAFNDSDRLGADKRAIGSISPGINLPSDAILIGNRLITSGTSGDIRSLSVRNPVRNGRINWREVVSK